MYVPASDKRKTNKAASLCVDTLAFDLEDGVAVNQKVRNVKKKWCLQLALDHIELIFATCS